MRCVRHARPDAPEIKAFGARQTVHSWNRFERPAVSLYPSARGGVPVFAISNARNPYAVWDPAIWGWERLADFRGYAV